MNHCPQNSTGNLSATTGSAAATAATTTTTTTAVTAAATAAAANSNESKRGRKDNDTQKRKRALPQEAKIAKRMKKVKQEMGSTGEELNQLNAASSNIHSTVIEIRMGLRLALQKMAHQEGLMVDILDAMEEGDSVKVNELVEILFST